MEARLKELIEQHLSIVEIASKLGLGRTTVKLYLKKFGLKTKFRLKNYTKVGDEYFRKCPGCKESSPPCGFYNRRNGKGNSVYCKKCTGMQTVERQQKFKRDCIQYKGGKCVKCSYDRCSGALDFHHTDPDQKDFEIAKSAYRLTDQIRVELDKCLLLCSNCHRETHWALTNPH